MKCSGCGRCADFTPIAYFFIRSAGVIAQLQEAFEIADPVSMVWALRAFTDAK